MEENDFFLHFSCSCQKKFVTLRPKSINTCKWNNMKKGIILLFVYLSTLCAYGQMSLDCDTTYFQCSKIFKEIKAYNQVYKRFKDNNIDWATALKFVFPTDKDSLLRFTYIVQTDSAVDMNLVKKVCTDWYDIAFSSKQVAIIEQSDNYILGKGLFYTIGQNTIPAIVYYKIIRVNAQIDIIMRFKENRLKFEIVGRHYQYITGDSSGRSNNDLIVPGYVFPFVEMAKHSDTEVYAQSYINFCNNSLSLSRSFLDYLNKNIHPKTVQEDEDW